MQRLLMIGMNHATAPLPVREKCAFSPTQREAALLRFRDRFPEAEVILVSTCNRVELYAARPVHAHPRREEMIEFVAQFHGLEGAELGQHLYQRQGPGVAEHLFAVASSLDSLVLGETQILGQVREAYEVAQRLGTANSLLGSLFQRAIAAAREVMTATRLGEGRQSVASIAVDYARQIFERFDDKVVLSIGAGKMSALVLQRMSDLKVKRLVVANRDVEKAQSLAGEFGGVAAGLDRVTDLLAEADIVVTSTAATAPIITRAMFEKVMKLRRWRRVFVVDIAMPRDVEEAVGELDNVYLYNIDDLQQVASATASARQDAVDRARELVKAQVEEFIIWQRTREVGPMIERLYEKSHAMAKDELSRMLSKAQDLRPEHRDAVEEMVRRIVNKLLNDPIQAVRGGGGAMEPGTHVGAFARLFKLGEPGTHEKQE